MALQTLLVFMRFSNLATIGPIEVPIAQEALKMGVLAFKE
jgi:hypothetical protein